MKNICRNIKVLGKIKLTLQLSNSVVTLLQESIETESVELNRFIEDSIKNHLDFLTTGPGGDSTSPTVKLEVQISTLLAFKLWWKAFINKTSISNIVNEALSLSIPCLLEQNQAQIDYRLEVELGE